jgi:membrane-associated protein
MNTFLPLLISWLQLYGYPVLGVSVFCASVGVPLPVSLMLLAAGAFAALGDFNIGFLLIIAVVASTSGDSVGYCIGRFGGSKLLAWVARQKYVRYLSPRAHENVTRSRLYFQKRGGWAIFLSRFLFSALGGTINLIAGTEFFPYPRFLVLDFSGEFLGALIPLVLGYAFGASWEEVGDILAAVSVLITALLLAGYLAYRLVKMLRRTKLTPTKPFILLPDEKLDHHDDIAENDFQAAFSVLPPSDTLERIHDKDKFPMNGRDKFPTS